MTRKHVTAKVPKAEKPFKYTSVDGQIKRSLLYIGNLKGHKSFLTVGAMFTDLDIWKRFAHSGQSRFKYLGSGFAVGDAFVNYDRPLFRVIEKTKHAHRWRAMTDQEQEILERQIRRVKGELRWRKGSWNEDKKRIARRQPISRGAYNVEKPK